jgi:diguanylate cyclase (GGDEF)-like protein
MNLISFFEKRSKLFWAIVGLLLVVLLGLINYITGYELSFSLFYLVPISLVAWFGGKKLGLVISAASAIAWFNADFINGHRYSNPSLYFWNTLIRLGVFLVITYLLSALQRAYKINQELSRTDYVTGAISVRHFYELAKIEISRFRRYKHPFSLVYIDLDNFKAINDRLGHITGDKLLRVLTENIQNQIRPTDILARLGGDEFALLLSETGEEDVKKVISRIHSNSLNEMLRNGWVVTFSVGVITYNEMPKSVDDMVKMADNAMYSIKTSTKNGVCYRIFNG